MEPVPQTAASIIIHAFPATLAEEYYFMRPSALSVGFNIINTKRVTLNCDILAKAYQEND